MIRRAFIWRRIGAALILLICRSLCHGQAEQSAPPVQMKVVKGVPFSAKVITESNQMLSDGNYVARTSTGFIARDSEGHTRREQALPQSGNASSVPTSIIFIQDPSSGSAYVLEPQSRLARKSSIASVDVRSHPQSQDSVHNSESTTIKTESLGTQVFDGIAAEGTRITRTLAAGQAGNERPMNVVSETWYSNELQTLLSSKTIDPRLGETTYRLTEIQRGEPLYSLFQIPSDYIVRDQPQPPTITGATNK